MAIIVEEEKKNTPWFSLLVIVLVLGFLGFGTYYLFFKPVPGIEQFTVSPDMESVSKVSKVNLDMATVTDSVAYKMLMSKISQPELKNFGRSNPFASF
ncbi:MAG: hypothetical protein A3E61_02345 [Candidatus Colwellbacteria bacterium RIFCSPHIGHO2_12_FULL_43_12]|uniref:Uncharacterized protein n=3 Tax=Candidatus Colwelliibacteriota TaxID=1817904 RepID=A0A1G1YXP2_9BACT|nr:MAG: hypothetical protein A3D47_00380 [Candidatus Colwellbacteria bacterium RIFCSPHIGHO2_02_FULL_43_15]OGY59103.1 MAG: hypothetical protein A3E61_02345 [Candidatus Colwellbacteria bacterium RIFCSPHIGHO2_12_FULL_43_12]OGY60649.1 MAG: hypothetical protein A3F99_01455 [Candidatus Colwellbacteria bacterium RIFCSPLOWO2_12_FULL_43_11]